MTGWSIFGSPTRGRSCGSCKACCIQVPVELPDGIKPANQRCKHLRSTGCGIYDKRPEPCRYWSCKWLFDDSTANLRRPDQSGYIIDPALDTCLRDGEPFDVVQIWVDPARPDAHRDPALRAWLNEVGRIYELPSIVRWNSRDGLVLIPPSLTADGTWLEVGGVVKTQEDIRAQVAAWDGAPRTTPSITVEEGTVAP